MKSKTGLKKLRGFQMKKLLALTTLVAAICTFNVAEARTIQRPQSSTERIEFVFRDLQISADSLLLGGEHFQSAYAQVDTEARKVTITFRYPQIFCVTAPCPSNDREPKVVELQLLSISHGYCGGLFIDAGNDSELNDAPSRHLGIYHAGYNACEKSYSDAATATLTEAAMGPSTAVSTFTGERLIRYYTQGTF
jgi:hypothetical protein